MKYYIWEILDDDIIVIRKSREWGYEPYFGKDIGFHLDVYDDYLSSFVDDLHNNPEKITEISEEEAYKILNLLDY